MIDLERLIRESEAQRSLFMAYSVSLAHFEASLLSSLISSGAAEVMLLADGRECESSYSEMGAIEGPGIQYAFHPVRVGGRGGAFHPKFYFIESANGMKLIVASVRVVDQGVPVRAIYHAPMWQVVRLATLNPSERGPIFVHDHPGPRRQYLGATLRGEQALASRVAPAPRSSAECYVGTRYW